MASGLASVSRNEAVGIPVDPAGRSESTSGDPECEYIVVGSGAGGGTVAARLAEAGHSVVLLEAGEDPRELHGGDPLAPGRDRLPIDYDVPAFHAFASENDALKRDFFVRHYCDDTQRLDPKFREMWNGRRVDGVLYPRAGALGGCTAHNAMIFVYPHNDDWNYIANLTGDKSWSAENMRRYFERIEDCRYRPILRWIAKLGINPTRHGWKGWLRTERAIPMLALEDGEFIKLFADTIFETLIEDRTPLQSIRQSADSRLDPNDWRLVNANAEGIRFLPLTTRNHARAGTRERVLQTAEKYPNRLRIQLKALATRVLLNSQKQATGVEYLFDANSHSSNQNSANGSGELRRVFASREVILAGGAFNTPQLLMLSGIGPPDALRRHAIEVKVELPGVGQNLQDRYEIGVVCRMHSEWTMLKNAQFAPGDPQFNRWQRKRDGVYATNGVAFGIIKRSAPELPLPDLFLLGLLGPFGGYFPGYSRLFAENHDCFTWTILKAHTLNRAGEVTLRSADPRDPPIINFNYFTEGAEQDMKSVIHGIRLARRLIEGTKCRNLVLKEELPGEDLKSDQELAEFVRRNAWGHHASCSCPIGPREQNGVLGSDFKVHGAERLRVVDASVFPKIPGFFIVSSIYMIAEKAADAILADHR